MEYKNFKYISTYLHADWGMGCRGNYAGRGRDLTCASHCLEGCRWQVPWKQFSCQLRPAGKGRAPLGPTGPWNGMDSCIGPTGRGPFVWDQRANGARGRPRVPFAWDQRDHGVLVHGTNSKGFVWHGPIAIIIFIIVRWLHFVDASNLQGGVDFFIHYAFSL
jgi:hypothetical protein